MSRIGDFDDDDVQTVVKAFVKIEPKHMQFHAKAVKGGFLRPGDADPDTSEEPATVTRLVDDACSFLNRPGFDGGTGCALHIAAREAGERPLDWKPNVCWQVPIRLEHSPDDNGHVTSRLREWKRRDWGEGGDEFHWWCTEAPEAFSGAEPVYRTSRDEIVELIGQQIAQQLGVEDLHQETSWASIGCSLRIVSTISPDRTRSTRSAIPPIAALWVTISTVRP